jgi:transcriptional regulator with XRE-family HTH domain
MTNDRGHRDVPKDDADSSDYGDSLGGRLRHLREEHRYSMRELGGIAGVSASLISDAERGRSEPSISVLKRLAGALGTTLTYFFSDPTMAESRVVRRSDRRSLGEHPASNAGRGTGVRFELASPEEARAIEAIVGVYPVGASLGDEPLTHEGEEWGMILEGRMKVSVGDEVHFLDPGDSIWFPSTTPHRLENVSDGITKYIWIDTPKSF